LDYFVLIILIASIYYLIRSACLSLKALEIREYNYIFHSKSNSKERHIELVKNDEETSLMNALKAKALNDLRITKISNYVSQAYSSIRNGVIGFALVLIRN